MPDAWNAAVYRERAAAWRDKATTLPEGSRERDVCQEIAQGYDDLADLIEQQLQISTGPATAHRLGRMTRIVTTTYRYKPPAEEAEGGRARRAGVVTAKRSRHPLRAKQAAAEVVSLPQSEAAQPSTSLRPTTIRSR